MMFKDLLLGAFNQQTDQTSLCQKHLRFIDEFYRTQEDENIDIKIDNSENSPEENVTLTLILKGMKCLDLLR